MNSRTVLCVLLITAAVLAFCPGVHAAQPPGAGKPATVVVTTGEKVRRGQSVARMNEGELGADVHSSIDGTVTAATAEFVEISR